MRTSTAVFEESNFTGAPLQELRLTVNGTALAPLIADAERELHALGLGALKPKFYLSTEWGVAFGTVAVAIPFYLASDHLTALHAQRNGHVEGFAPHDILRYLRHELGHVVNYAFRLYEREDWAAAFGSIEQPYEEDYRPVPFDQRFVRHLPGWYAQKHPDEDWAETFAVCITPSTRWETEYAEAPVALAKLQLCARILKSLAGQPPLLHDDSTDEEVSTLRRSIDQIYDVDAGSSVPLTPSFDATLHTIVDGLVGAEPKRLLSALMVREERSLMAQTYQWTGHFPERTRSLMRQLSARAHALELVYPVAEERAALIGLTALLTTLAMNFVQRGRYLP